MKHKRWKIIFYILLIGILYCAGLAAYVVYDNYNVRVTDYNIYSEKLPSAFDKYKIALITDFHSSSNIDKIVSRVKSIEPNIICMVGDMINMDDDNFDNFSVLMDKFTDIAPTYYTFGNHEIWSNKTNKLSGLAMLKGVTLMNGDVRVVSEEGSEINFIGFKDPGTDDFHVKKEYIKDNLKKLYNKRKIKDGFTVLLMHRVNYFEQAAASDYDLVLSGHLHGGQVNLPFVQKMILLNNTNSNTYSKGLYRMNDSQMVIGSGLELNIVSPRMFNTPEVVCVQLNAIGR